MELNDQEEVEFRVNKGYADNYNRWRRKEELQKYKDKYGADVDEEDSSSSETEDEDAEGLTPQIERDFFRTLSIVKSKDPKMYQTDVHFYEEEESDENSEHPQEGSRQKQAQRSKGDRPMYLKDYERKIIVEKEGQYTDDKGDEDDDDEEEDQEEILRAASPTYVQEQRQIRESFYSAVHDVSGDDDDDVLKVKQKSKEEKEEEEKDYIKWLKGEKSEPAQDETGTSEMNALRKFWNDPELDEGERFLRDFILNKGYIDKDPSGLSGFHVDDDDEDDDNDDEDGDGGDRDANQEDFSEEERILEEQEEFERKYNFRFEEPDSDFIKRYPRTVADTVRRKDVKRSDKRKEKRSRKEEEKAKKQEELKHLKNLKKQEIVERLDKLKEVTGNEAVGFDLDDLEGDFDPEEHDRLMQKVFNDQYDEHEEDIKPTFDEEDEPGEENWDEWNRQDYESGNYGDGEYYEGYEETEGPHCEDADFVMDADYEEQSAAEKREKSQKELAQEMMGASRKKRKKMSRFARSLLKKKPVFNPEDKSFEDYIDEYYRLDYEDTIGDLACRFKYRTVQANDFGLSTEEILKAREKELNQWASLKKTCQYRSEEEENRDVALFRKMRENAAKKKRIFLSFQESDEEESTADDVQPATQTSASADSEEQSRKRKRSHKRRKGEPNTTANDDTSVASKPPSKGKENGTTADKPRTSERVEEVEKGGTEKAKMGKSLVDSDTRTAQKVGGADTKLGNEPERNVRNAVGDSPVVPAAAAAAGTLSSREKKKQRKQEILAKLKAMRRAKGPKRLQGARPRVRMGDRNMSEARFRAYGLNPKKHRYRLAHEKAASGR